MTPNAIKYETCRANEIRMRAGRQDFGAPESIGRIDRSMFLTPTTRLALWMLRRPNRGRALPIALVLVPLYLLAAECARGAADVDADWLMWIVTPWATWNAIKVAGAGLVAAATSRSFNC